MPLLGHNDHRGRGPADAAGISRHRHAIVAAAGVVSAGLGLDLAELVLVTSLESAANAASVRFRHCVRGLGLRGRGGGVRSSLWLTQCCPLVLVLILVLQNWSCLRHRQRQTELRRRFDSASLSTD